MHSEVRERKLKQIKVLEQLLCEEIPKRLGPYCPERRRWRGDVIKVYKVIMALTKLTVKQLFKSYTTKTWGHAIELVGDWFKLNTDFGICCPGNSWRPGSVSVFRKEVDES